MPSDVIPALEEVVGLADVPHTTPFAEMVPDAASMAVPPLLALVLVMLPAAVVVTDGVATAVTLAVAALAVK